MSIATQITRIQNEVSTQTDLIDQIATALASKVAGSGTDIETCTVTFTQQQGTDDVIVSYDTLVDGQIVSQTVWVSPDSTYVFENVPKGSIFAVSANLSYYMIRSVFIEDNMYECDYSESRETVFYRVAMDNDGVLGGDTCALTLDTTYMYPVRTCTVSVTVTEDTDTDVMLAYDQASDSLNIVGKTKYCQPGTVNIPNVPIGSVFTVFGYDKNYKVTCASEDMCNLDENEVPTSSSWRVGYDSGGNRLSTNLCTLTVTAVREEPIKTCSVTINWNAGYVIGMEYGDFVIVSYNEVVNDSIESQTISVRPHDQDDEVTVLENIPIGSVLTVYPYAEDARLHNINELNTQQIASGNNDHALSYKIGVDTSGNVLDVDSCMMDIGISSPSFTADATATAADILSGKTAYVNGSKVTGTIADFDGSYECSGDSTGGSSGGGGVALDTCDVVVTGDCNFGIPYSYACTVLNDSGSLAAVGVDGNETYESCTISDVVCNTAFAILTSNTMVLGFTTDGAEIIAQRDVASGTAFKITAEAGGTAYITIIEDD